MSIISTKYQNTDLRLIQEIASIKDVWNTHPVKLSEVEVKTIQLAPIISALQHFEKPSDKAKIKGDLTPFVKELDQLFKNQINEYKTKLEEATEEDKKTIDKYKQIGIYEDYYGFYWLWKLVGKSFMTRKDFEIDTRAHRFKWIITVGCMEEEKLKYMKNEIRLRIVPLVLDLEELKQKNQIDLQIAKTAFQLQKIFKAYFPNEPLDDRLSQLLPQDRFDELKD